MLTRRRRCWRMTIRSPAARWCRRSTRPRCSPSPTMPRWPTPSPAGGGSQSIRAATIRRSWSSRRRSPRWKAPRRRAASPAAWRRSARRCWPSSARASASSRCATAMATPTGSSSGFLPRLNIKVDYVDGSDADAVAAALPGAKLLYLESPTSMMFELQDIGHLTRLAREQGIVTTLDNSWATPIFQKPILHGVDLVLHSASKYLGGHSDTVAGVVAGSASSSQAHQRADLFLSRRQAFALRGLAAAARPAHAAAQIAAPYEERPDDRRAAEGPRSRSSGSTIRSIPTIRARRRLAAMPGCSPSR